MPLHAVAAETFREQPWANGAGSTVELARDAVAGRWRLSVARIDTDAAFSELPGIERRFTPLDQPLRLQFASGDRLDVHRLQVVQFAGDKPPHCHLTEGPSRAFNLMQQASDGPDTDLIARPLLGTMALFAAPGSRWFVYLAAGQANLSQADAELSLQSGDAAWVSHAAGARTLIEGAGDLVLARLPLD